MVMEDLVDVAVEQDLKAQILNLQDQEIKSYLTVVLHQPKDFLVVLGTLVALDQITKDQVEVVVPVQQVLIQIHLYPRPHLMELVEQEKPQQLQDLT
tara:strand:+ start:136 stop:426 length:291 start_codon:yes stop_codon:yes gene_type:complete